MRHFYLIPGLGTDERIFSPYTLPMEHTHIHWIPPLKNESLRAYAIRLCDQLNPAHEPVFLGVSFGGMLAQEMASQIPGSKILLVSSVKSRNELPWMMQIQRYLPLYKTIPLDKKKWEKTFGITEKFFGVQTESERKILRSILADLDISFVKWAVGAIIQWDRTTPEPGIVHWHGTKDLIFPISNCKNTIPIQGGSHFMLYTHANQLSELLAQYWKTFQTP